MECAEVTTNCATIIDKATVHDTLLTPIYDLGAVGIISKCVATKSDDIAYKVKYKR